MEAEEAASNERSAGEAPLAAAALARVAAPLGGCVTTTTTRRRRRQQATMRKENAPLGSPRAAQQPACDGPKVWTVPRWPRRSARYRKQADLAHVGQEIRRELEAKHAIDLKPFKDDIKQASVEFVLSLEADGLGAWLPTHVATVLTCGCCC